jgi:hypothetical protein
MRMRQQKYVQRNRRGRASSGRSQAEARVRWWVARKFQNGQALAERRAKETEGGRRARSTAYGSGYKGFRRREVVAVAVVAVAAVQDLPHQPQRAGQCGSSSK